MRKRKPDNHGATLIRKWSCQGTSCFCYWNITGVADISQPKLLRHESQQSSKSRSKNARRITNHTFLMRARKRARKVAHNEWCMQSLSSIPLLLADLPTGRSFLWPDKVCHTIWSWVISATSKRSFWSCQRVKEVLPLLTPGFSCLTAATKSPRRVMSSHGMKSSCEISIGCDQERKHGMFAYSICEGKTYLDCLCWSGTATLQLIQPWLLIWSFGYLSFTS
jgi:hypothetical protein